MPILVTKQIAVPFCRSFRGRNVNRVARALPMKPFTIHAEADLREALHD